jgi:hypothetical protein
LARFKIDEMRDEISLFLGHLIEQASERIPEPEDVYVMGVMDRMELWDVPSPVILTTGWPRSNENLARGVPVHEIADL